MAIRLILICTLLSLAALSVLVDGHRAAPITARAPVMTAG
ncbi:hypothetical protein OVA11_11660 [Caulobacter sp. SL161]|nr:hypothetical protein [Caulobacter sp. SL161]MCY1647690.1 hypothetical protein [Caulobacter sp. SL161]